MYAAFLRTPLRNIGEGFRNESSKENLAVRLQHRIWQAGLLPAMLLPSLLLPAAATSALGKPPLPTMIESAEADDIRPEPAAEAEPTPDAAPAPAPASTPAATPPVEVIPSGEEPRGDQLSEGVWIHRDADGRALCKGAYQAGQRQGLWIRYFAVGEGKVFATEPFQDFQPPFTAEAHFTDDRLNGKCSFYDAERKLAAEWELRDNVVQGVVCWYFPDGTPRQRSTFRDGFLHGEQTVWDAQGKIVEVSQHAGGLRLIPHEELLGPEVVGCTGAHVDTSRRVVATFDWWPGLADIAVIESEPAELKHGVWTWYYETGQEELQGAYQEGTPTGVFTWWYENGQRQQAGPYVNGLPHGEFTRWYANGQKQQTSVYSRGEKTGVYTRWDSAGMVLEKGTAATERIVESADNTIPVPSLESSPQPGSRLKKRSAVAERPQRNRY